MSLTMLYCQKGGKMLLIKSRLIKTAIIMVIISGLFLFAGCFSVKLPQEEITEPEPQEEEAREESQEASENEASPGLDVPIMLDIYFMKVTDTSFELGKETREFGKFGGPQVDLEEVMVELLKGPKTDDLSRIIPEGTALRGITLEYGVAYADFSEELLQADVGSEAEAVLVDSIVKTLTQLEEVDSVQILVEGEIVETIAGHITINEPLN
jgi:spore germination protein GerM